MSESTEKKENITEENKKQEFVSEQGMKFFRSPEDGIGVTHDYDQPEFLYKELMDRMRKYHPSADLFAVEKAYKIARDAHKDQKRKSGEPYIIHPLSVAIILANLELDKESVIAGILHDVVEDTEMTTEDLEKEFGEEVAVIVDGVTKLGQLSYSADKLDKQAENLRKMFLAMAKDIRVILVKLADRLHNMRTLQHMKPEKQKEKAKETLDIYAPLAQRLGISKVKIDLEDLSLKYLNPDMYYQLVRDINEKKEERDRFVADIVKEVKEGIEGGGIEATVYGRAKHFFSIFRKMINQDKTIDQIYDMFAVRIIVENVRDCYAALGLIHEMYTPIPGRFKDYIAMPKPNMYQSLHTTLIAKNGRPFEIQIRTKEMHRIAEYGIAAHWKYKEAQNGQKSGPQQEEEKLNWLRQILEWQQDASDNKEFMSLVKSDLNLFNDNVYCFSPAGEVKTLPNGSCPIDFAYLVHSAVGNKMVGARINGKLVPIETKLKNGDRVEIITSQNSRGPSRDWLKVVKSTQAKNRINQWFRKMSQEDNINTGREMLINYAKAKGKNISLYTKPEYLEIVMNKYGFKTWEAVLAAVGHGGLREGQVFNKLVDAYEKNAAANITDEEVLENISEINKAPEGEKKTAKGGILVKGLDDVAVRFSKCCSPIPGDEIVGFVTRGRGVTIHRTDCINVLNMPENERDRLIDAEWAKIEETGNRKYAVEIKLYASNRNGLIVDISKVFTEKKIEIITMNVRLNKQGVATFDIGFEIVNKEALQAMIDSLRQVPGVMDIERTRG